MGSDGTIAVSLLVDGWCWMILLWSKRCTLFGSVSVALHAPLSDLDASSSLLLPSTTNFFFFVNLYLVCSSVHLVTMELCSEKFRIVKRIMHRMRAAFTGAVGYIRFLLVVYSHDVF